MRFVASSLVAWGLVLALAGCSTDRHRVLLLAVDGTAPDLVDRMLTEGRLPSFPRLRLEGAYARWSSSPSEAGWAEILSGSPRGQPPLLWDIVSSQRRKVAVVGWPEALSREAMASASPLSRLGAYGSESPALAWKTDRSDLMAVFLSSGVDVPVEPIARLHHYDGVVHDLLESIDDSTVLALVFLFRTGDGVEGSFSLYGAGVRQHRRFDGSGPLDLAPTLLALLGLPASEDMTGHLAEQAVRVDPIGFRLGSYDPLRPRPRMSVASLLEQAAELAKEGKYPEAVAILARAQELEPANVTIFQYRANVAYLRGDIPAAIDALEQALRLEPGNSLFESNLRRLRELQR